MPKRRNLHALLSDVESAGSAGERALAHFRLALFHDNNSRESQAVPHYKEALRLGLDRKTEAEALAWLASSLFKTGAPEEALERLKESLSLAADPELVKFLAGLKGRVTKALEKAANGAGDRKT